MITRKTGSNIALARLSAIKPLIFIVLFSCCLPLFSGAQTLDELRKRKEKTQKEIEYLNSLINETGENTRATVNKLSMLNQQIELRNNLIIDYNTQLSMLQKSIGENMQTIQSMNDDLATLRARYEAMIKQAFRNRGNYSQLVFLLSSANFNQAYKRMFYIRQMARYRKKQSEEIEMLKASLETQTVELNNKKKEQTEILNQQMAETSKLNLEKEKQAGYQKQLQKKEKELKRKLQEQQRLERKLQEGIERLIAQEVKKSKTTAATPEEKLLSSDFANNKGRFPWPVQNGVITDRFGVHAHPVMKQLIIENDGIDISTSPGEKARAIFNGTVSRIFSLTGGNLAVIIRHGEYMTVYSNLREVFVKQGDTVNTKQEIGLIFTDTFEDNKTTLKFQIRKETLKLNPEEWISR
jgi:septal ring factor EnvC (AmiA/AmiB activator)